MTESAPPANVPATATTSTTGIRPRYAPPNQRSRSLSRRKSGDRLFDKVNNPSSSHEVDKSLKNVQFPAPAPVVRDHGEARVSAGTSSGLLSENLLQPASGVITLNGCSRSRASQLLSDRWAAAIHSYNDPSIDLSERPVMYTGASSSAWGHSRLSHQMDFLTELRRAICETNANIDE